jgi:carbon storage regulator
MLVLTRRIGETIVIDGNILVTVVAVQGDRIRLGVAAPASVTVHRQEVHERCVEFAAAPNPLTVTPPPRRWKKTRAIPQLTKLPPAPND